MNDVYKDLPTTALALLDHLLAVEPGNRGTAASALDSEVSRQLALTHVWLCGSCVYANFVISQSACLVYCLY